MSYSSDFLFSQAKQLFPGGVNSPVRAFVSVGGTPPFMHKGQGAYLWDVENNRYIDYVGGYGPFILGHAHPKVIEQLQLQLNNGLCFGAPHALENQLAQCVQELMPSMQQMRFVSSGTEAVLSAIRLARGYSQRDIIVKFSGCYHGHSDSVLVKAGSGAATCGTPDSKGIPKEITKHTYCLPYNDSQTLADFFASQGNHVAAVIVEPIAGNMNLCIPDAMFLHEMRRLCDKFGAVLIFDEVMTGFRVNLHGAQGLYGITPDLTCLGKIIGGGLPVGAFGGKKEIMQMLAPLGGVYQAGTLSGHPLAMSAGLATLEILRTQGSELYRNLERLSRLLIDGLGEISTNKSNRISGNAIGGMFGIYIPENIDFATFYHSMLQQGVYMAPSRYEAGFISIAHSEADIHKTLQAAEYSMQQLCCTA